MHRKLYRGKRGNNRLPKCGFKYHICESIIPIPNIEHDSIFHYTNVIQQGGKLVDLEPKSRCFYLKKYRNRCFDCNGVCRIYKIYKKKIQKYKKDYTDFSINLKFLR